jgi:glycogen synthase
LKILFSSYLFDPSVGGVESVSKILAKKFATAGNEVHLITESPGEPPIGADDYQVTRRPTLAKLFSLLRWCDLLFQNNISLRSLIPGLLLQKSTLVVHQTWLTSPRGEMTWNNRIKRALLSRVANVAISKAVADTISGHSFVIGNPYDDSVFQLMPDVARGRGVVFVGRLVSDKGADLLLQALKLLHDNNLFPDLTIVGSGPEEKDLRRLVGQLGLGRQVEFAGKKSGAELAEILNRHSVLVVPSRWAEPFGVVALEAIACGCVVIGSENGGLKEAIGPCGVTFANGNICALADQLERLLSNSKTQGDLRQHAPEHLAKFKPEAIAAAYLRIMRKLLQ